MKIKQVFMAEQNAGMNRVCMGWGDTRDEAMKACFSEVKKAQAEEQQFSEQYAAEQQETALSLEMYGEPKQ